MVGANPTNFVQLRYGGARNKKRIIKKGRVRFSAAPPTQGMKIGKVRFSAAPPTQGMKTRFVGCFCRPLPLLFKNRPFEEVRLTRQHFLILGFIFLDFMVLLIIILITIKIFRLFQLLYIQMLSGLRPTKRHYNSTTQSAGAALRVYIDELVRRCVNNTKQSHDYK